MKSLVSKWIVSLETPVYYLKRLRIVDGVPYALERTYYNKDIVPYLGKEIAEGSIFRYLKRWFKNYLLVLLINI